MIFTSGEPYDRPPLIAQIAVPIEALFLINTLLYTSRPPSSIKDIAPPRPVPLVDNSSNPQQRFSLFSNKLSSICMYGACRYLQAPIAPPPLLVVQLLPINLVL